MEGRWRVVALCTLALVLYFALHSQVPPALRALQRDPELAALHYSWHKVRMRSALATRLWTSMDLVATPQTGRAHTSHLL